MAEDQSKPCDTGAFTITTPLGSMTSKGKRNAELISALSLGTLLVIGYAMYDHNQDSVRAHVERTKQIELIANAIEKLASSQRNLEAAQREMTCIISLPQERREAEYRSPSGMCKRISGNTQ